jgi:hypothetical protein
MTTDNISSECRSFFWVYAPVKMVEPKKQKVDDVSTYLHQLSKTKASANPVLAKIGDTEHTHDIDQRHISIAEQYRSGDHFHDYQPMETADEIKAIVDSLQGAAHHYDPIKLGGSSMEMIQRGNKVHITLQFNSECAQVFEAIHEDIRANLGNQTRFGGVKPLECPRLFLAKGYNHELRGHDLSACCASFNHSHNRFKTKPVLLDRLVLGQGFFYQRRKKCCTA